MPLEPSHKNNPAQENGASSILIGSGRNMDEENSVGIFV